MYPTPVKTTYLFPNTPTVHTRNPLLRLYTMVHEEGLRWIIRGGPSIALVATYHWPFIAALRLAFFNIKKEHNDHDQPAPAGERFVSRCQILHIITMPWAYPLFSGFQSIIKLSTSLLECSKVG